MSMTVLFDAHYQLIALGLFFRHIFFNFRILRNDYAIYINELSYLLVDMSFKSTHHWDQFITETEKNDSQQRRDVRRQRESAYDKCQNI